MGRLSVRVVLAKKEGRQRVSTKLEDPRLVQIVFAIGRVKGIIFIP